jgi:PAS domain S-box-containing protein
MRVAVLSDDAQLRRQLVAEIEGSGFDVVDDPSSADVVVLDAPAEDVTTATGRLLSANLRLELVVVLPSERLAEVDNGVAELVVSPPSAGELSARLGMIARRQGRAGPQRKDILALAVEAAGDVVEITDSRAVMQYVNPAFCRTLGFAAEEAIGKTPAQMVRSDAHDPAYFQNIDRTLSAGEVWKGLLVSSAKDGRAVHLETTIAPVRDATGTVTHHVAVKRDITARIHAEARLQAANEQLETARDAALDASKVKSQFLANMSHELRTPLNAIIGYSEMMIEEAEDDGDDAAIADLGKIRSAGRHLLGIINDLLDLSKIEAGRMQLNIESFDLRRALEAVVGTLEPLARDRRNSFRVDYRLAGTEVAADEARLRQVMMNLLSNANKFTEDGIIEVVARAEGNDGFYAIDVRDSGIGMPADVLERLFQPFMQADATTTRKYGGTGLGLTITKRFCEMMGGTVSAASEPGRGSTFTVLLPYEVERSS